MAATTELETAKRPHTPLTSTTADTAISLKIKEAAQVLVVGRSLDFALCPKLMGDGQTRCQDVMDKSRDDLCEFHRAKQYKKFAAKRNDTMSP